MMDVYDKRLLLDVLGRDEDLVEIENSDVLRVQNSRNDPALQLLLDQMTADIAKRDALVRPYRTAKDRSARASGEAMALWGEIKSLNARAAKTRAAMAVLVDRSHG